ncbi:MAG: hypothetical protein P4L53_12595 [Candidatus Obscuribacterales bacterium]|nr:hypothetical protein [Candidatus Obscuribacterales bacterium]
MSERISLRDLTTQLEKGDGSSVSNAFSGKFEEERFRDLDAISKLNQDDLKAGRTDTTLHITHDFYYKDTISIRATKGGFDEFMGGKMLYQDDLSMSDLKHTDINDKVPAVRQPVDVPKLAESAENGDGKAIETALSGKYQEERASILTDIEKQNKADLAAQKTNATLEISLAGSKHSANAMSISRVLAGAHDYWMGGVQIYGESLDPVNGKRVTLAKADERK